jgi:hypothetical protein
MIFSFHFVVVVVCPLHSISTRYLISFFMNRYLLLYFPHILYVIVVTIIHMIKFSILHCWWCVEQNRPQFEWNIAFSLIHMYSSIISSAFLYEPWPLYERCPNCCESLLLSYISSISHLLNHYIHLTHTHTYIYVCESGHSSFSPTFWLIFKRFLSTPFLVHCNHMLRPQSSPLKSATRSWGLYDFLNFLLIPIPHIPYSVTLPSAEFPSLICWHNFIFFGHGPCVTSLHHDCF